MDTQTRRIASLLTEKLKHTTDTLEFCRKVQADIKSGETRVPQDMSQEDVDGLASDFTRCEAEHVKLIDLCYRLLPPVLVNKVRDEVLAHHNRLGYCSCPGPKIYILQ